LSFSKPGGNAAAAPRVQGGLGNGVSLPDGRLSPPATPISDRLPRSGRLALLLLQALLLLLQPLVLLPLAPLILDLLSIRCHPSYSLLHRQMGVRKRWA
jgi:hypothetical protein